MIFLISLEKNNLKAFEDIKIIKNNLLENYDMNSNAFEDDYNYKLLIEDIEQFNCDIIRSITKEIDSVIEWDVFEDEYFESFEREEFEEMQRLEI